METTFAFDSSLEVSSVKVSALIVKDLKKLKRYITSGNPYTTKLTPDEAFQISSVSMDQQIKEGNLSFVVN
ncbi:hypothetical protein [Pedobacter sp. GR22-6]|uniref:hypothetical protein n=1 Tax=Pedobacter sp. GR22-6 TaxID=3127957 RepID=UPI00307FBBE2